MLMQFVCPNNLSLQAAAPPPNKLAWESHHQLVMRSGTLGVSKVAQPAPSSESATSRRTSAAAAPSSSASVVAAAHSSAATTS